MNVDPDTFTAAFVAPPSAMSMAPPPPTLWARVFTRLPTKVEPETVRVPMPLWPSSIAPPPVSAVLFEKVELATVTVPNPSKA
jgi:hypothetical protein